jgi:hypothetical protein
MTTVSQSSKFADLERRLNRNGTTFEVIALDMLDAGHNFDDIAAHLLETADISVSGRTVRRWVKNVGRAGRPS